MKYILEEHIEPQSHDMEIDACFYGKEQGAVLIFTKPTQHYIIRREEIDNLISKLEYFKTELDKEARWMRLNKFELWHQEDDLYVEPGYGDLPPGFKKKIELVK